MFDFTKSEAWVVFVQKDTTSYEVAIVKDGRTVKNGDEPD